jgi:hypothetical protein
VGQHASLYSRPDRFRDTPLLVVGVQDGESLAGNDKSDA